MQFNKDTVSAEDYINILQELRKIYPTYPVAAILDMADKIVAEKNTLVEPLDE